MLRTLGRRLITAALTLLFVTLLVFLLIHLSPGEPLHAVADAHQFVATALSSPGDLSDSEAPLTAGQGATSS